MGDAMRTGMDNNSGRDAVRPWFQGLREKPLQGLTVLLVEDSRLASEAMRLLCLRSGARIRRADGLQSAERHLRLYRPGVAIVDMGLPDGDGGELIARIATMSPRIPVVLGLSGDPTLEDAALAAGADGFLAKPVDNLALFQQAILGRLPDAARPMGLRLLPDETVQPDATALLDDLAYLAQMLMPDMDDGLRGYAAGFLAGLGRVANDASLGAAAAELAREGDVSAILQVRSLIEHRLAGGRVM